MRISTPALFSQVELGKACWNGQSNRHRYRAAMNDVRSTPAELFSKLDEEFSFDLDVCALPDNAKCKRYFTPDYDGLMQDWAPSRCWMNPPYSKLPDWTAKALREARRGALVVGLLPARTEMRWFHQNVLGWGAEVRFVRGRVRFGLEDPTRQKWATAPFPSLIVVWGDANDWRLT